MILAYRIDITVIISLLLYFNLSYCQQESIITDRNNDLTTTYPDSFNVPFGNNPRANEDPCKSLCKCSGSFVDCANQQAIREIPTFNSSHAASITHLNLESTQIKDLSATITFPNVILLNVRNTKIAKLTGQEMSLFPNLKTLDAANCLISTVETTAITTLGQLEKLDLTKNSISTFPGNLLSLSLKYLLLGSNLLTNLTEISTGLSKLESLDLSDNSLRGPRIGMWSPPTQLEHISFQKNPLMIFRASRDFVNLQTLQSLDISFCSLNTLSDVVLIVNRMPNVWKIKMTGNAFSCNCSLYEDKVQLSKTGIVFSDEPQCTYPNGTVITLRSLSDDVCQNTKVTEPSQASLSLYMIIGGSVLAFIGFVLVVTFFVCLKRDRSLQNAKQTNDRRQNYNSNYDSPYLSNTTLNTNISGQSTMQHHQQQQHISMAMPVRQTSQDALEYGFDKQQPRARIFTKSPSSNGISNNHRIAKSSIDPRRAQSEQWLDAQQYLPVQETRVASTPLPPVPGETRQPSYLQMNQRKETPAQEYVDINDRREYQKFKPGAETMPTYEELTTPYAPV